MNSRDVNMLSGSVFKNFIVYTVPIFITTILQLLFNAADLVVVGQFVGGNSVGAVGATGSLTNTIVNLFIGISTGCGIYAAQTRGAGDEKRMQRIVHTAVPLAFFMGIAVSIIGIVFSKDLLVLMKTPEGDILPLSTLYMRIYFCGIPALLVYNFSAAILRAVGDTKSSMYYLTVSGVLNVVLNVIFVTVFKMNVAGVAIATVVSQILSAVLCLYTLSKRTDSCRFEFRSMKIYKTETFEFVRLGLPAGLQSSLFGISNILVQSSINSLGTAVVSGNAASSNVESFMHACTVAFCQAVTNFVGQNKGSGNFKRVKKVYICGVSCSVVMGILLGIITYIFGEQLLAIYIPDSAQSVAEGLKRLTIFCFSYFLGSFMDITVSAIRGLGLSLPPTIISLVAICAFRVVWINTVFPIFNTYESLMILYPITWTLSGIGQIICFINVYKKMAARHRALEENNILQAKQV